jgi:hypothetical protein
VGGPRSAREPQGRGRKGIAERWCGSVSRGTGTRRRGLLTCVSRLCVDLTWSGGREVSEAVRPASIEATRCAFVCIFESRTEERREVLRVLSSPIPSRRVGVEAFGSRRLPKPESEGALGLPRTGMQSRGRVFGSDHVSASLDVGGMFGSRARGALHTFGCWGVASQRARSSPSRRATGGEVDRVPVSGWKAGVRGEPRTKAGSVESPGLRGAQDLRRERRKL